MTEQDKDNIKNAILRSVSETRNVRPCELAELACKAINYINTYQSPSDVMTGEIAIIAIDRVKEIAHEVYHAEFQETLKRRKKLIELSEQINRELYG